MKRILFCALLTACFTVTYGQANLREMVGVVRPVYHESTIEFLTDFSNSLNRDGYKDAAKYIKAYTEGGFGSGFVINVPQTGKSYIITNKHVVAQAKEVNIEFLLANKSVISYKSCPIAAIDKYLDIAAIELPKGTNIENGFTFSSKEITDGEEVFSVGFPVLQKEPSWQLGKGIISNNSFHSKELTGNEDVKLLQHTAQIDPGSSGGPIIIKSPSTPDSYEVVGINTWKASGREGANFAIPAESIKLFIDNHLVNDNTPTINDLQNQINSFINASKDSYKSVLPYVAYYFFKDLTADGFYNILNSAQKDVTDAVVEQFNLGYPIEGVKIALANVLAQELSKKILSCDNLPSNPNIDGIVPVQFNYGEKPITIEWVFEQGNWKIANLPSLNFNSYGKKGIATDFGYYQAIKIGVGFPNSDIETTNYSIEFSKSYRTFITMEWGATFGKIEKLNSSDMPLENDNITTTEMTNYIDLLYGAGVQLPIRTKSLYIIPNGKAFIGLSTGADVFNGEDAYKEGFIFGYKTGLEVAYKLNNRTYLIGGLSYRHKKYSSQNEFVTKDIVLNIGFSF